MRLIDADKIGLTDFEIIMCNGDYKEALKMILDKIENAPTVCNIEQIYKEILEVKEQDYNKVTAVDFIYDKCLEIICKHTKGAEHDKE